LGRNFIKTGLWMLCSPLMQFLPHLGKGLFHFYFGFFGSDYTHFSPSFLCCPPYFTSFSLLLIFGTDPAWSWSKVAVTFIPPTAIHYRTLFRNHREGDFVPETGFLDQFHIGHQKDGFFVLLSPPGHDLHRAVLCTGKGHSGDTGEVARAQPQLLPITLMSNSV
jgi:hypothetical protein